jgi:hypothetical protein
LGNKEGKYSREETILGNTAVLDRGCLRKEGVKAMMLKEN